MTPTHHPDTPPHPHPYCRAQAIDDGLLIEVPTRLGRQFGFGWPLAVTTLAWFDAISWDTTAEQAKPRVTHETESGRIAEVLFAARLAWITSRTGAHEIPFVVHRVPPVGPYTRATRCSLQLSIHPGDHGETVATISQSAAPTAAGHFIIANLGPTCPDFTAVEYDQDADHLLWPVVTAHTLDIVLTEAIQRCPGVSTTTGDQVTHVHQPDAHPVTLRPDSFGLYHLEQLGWRCLLV